MLNSVVFLLVLRQCHSFYQPYVVHTPSSQSHDPLQPRPREDVSTYYTKQLQAWADANGTPRSSLPAALQGRAGSAFGVGSTWYIPPKEDQSWRGSVFEYRSVYDHCAGFDRAQRSSFKEKAAVTMWEYFSLEEPRTSTKRYEYSERREQQYTAYRESPSIRTPSPESYYSSQETVWERAERTDRESRSSPSSSSSSQEGENIVVECSTTSGWSGAALYLCRLLGQPRSITYGDLRRAYCEEVKRYHPDTADRSAEGVANAAAALIRFQDLSDAWDRAQPSLKARAGKA